MTAPVRVTPSRWAVALALVPLLYLVESFAYFSVRGTLTLALGGLGLSKALVGTISGLWKETLWIPPLFGGVVALVTGPRIAIALGGLATALGVAGLASENQLVVVLSLALVSLGKGLLQPAALGAAAEAVRPASPWAVAASFSLAMASVNVGAELAVRIATPAVQASLPSAYVGIAAIVVLATLIGAALAPASQRFGSFGANGEAAPALGLLLVLIAPAALAINPTMGLAVPSSLANDPAMFAFNAGTAAAVLNALLLPVALLVTRRAPRSSLFLFTALGSLLAALGAFAAAALPAGPLAAVAGVALINGAEPIVDATTLAVSAYAFRGRGTSMGIGAWLSVTYFIGHLGRVLPETPLVCVGFGVAVVATGIALVVFRGWLGRALEDAPPAAPGVSIATSPEAGA